MRLNFAVNHPESYILCPRWFHPWLIVSLQLPGVSTTLSGASVRLLLCCDQWFSHKTLRQPCPTFSPSRKNISVVGVDDRYVSFQIKLVMFSRDTIVISAVSATIGFLTCLLVVNTQDKQTGDLSLLGFSETNTPNSEEEDQNQLDNSASPSLHCDQGDDLLNLLSRWAELFKSQNIIFVLASRMENNLAGDAAVTDTAKAESLRKRLAEV